MGRVRSWNQPKYIVVITKNEEEKELSRYTSEKLPPLEVRANKRANDLARKDPGANIYCNYYLWDKTKWKFVKTSVSVIVEPQNENSVRP